MIVRIIDIPEEGLTSELSKDVEWLMTHVDSAREGELSFLKPITMSVTINIKDGDLFLDGTVKGLSQFRCSRCLEDFPFELNYTFSTILMPFTQSGAMGETELKSDDMDVGYYKDGQIDLTDIMVEQINLNLPMRPLCKEQCAGICPICGTNLNKSKCNCSREKFESPFAGLKNFKIKKNSRH